MCSCHSYVVSSILLTSCYHTHFFTSLLKLFSQSLIMLDFFFFLTTTYGLNFVQWIGFSQICNALYLWSSSQILLNWLLSELIPSFFHSLVLRIYCCCHPLLQDGAKEFLFLGIFTMHCLITCKTCFFMCWYVSLYVCLFWISIWWSNLVPATYLWGINNIICTAGL